MAWSTATAPPEGFGELAGEEELFGVAGLEGFVGLLAQGVELFPGFAVDEEAGGAEAVGKPIFAGEGFAGGGAGSFGLAGVLGVDFGACSWAWRRASLMVWGADGDMGLLGQ